MYLQRLPGAGCEPGRSVARGPGGYAALLERLTAAEAGIRDGRHRQPAVVLEAIARSWSEGATVREVAASAGVSREIVRDRLRRVGALEYLWSERHRHVQEVLESRGAELIAAYEAGASVVALARDAGISNYTVGKYLVDRDVAIRGRYGRSRKILAARGSELIAAYKAGGGFAPLAAEAGVSAARLREYLVDHGVAIRSRGWAWALLEVRAPELIAAYEAGASLEALAAEVGVSRVTVGRFMAARGVAPRGRRRRGQERLEERGDELIAAYEAGGTTRALAARFGVGRSTIGRFLADHGVRLRNDRGKVPRGSYAGGRSP